MSNPTKCTYCNAEIEEDSQFCSRCGKSIKENAENNSKSNIRQTCRNNTKLIGVLIIAIGIISCILLFNAGSQIKKSSISMETITSVAGNTVAEAYYQDMGQALKGFSYFCYGLGLAVLGVTMDSAVKKYSD